MNTLLLTVVGPQGRADVAAPADTALADLTAGGTAALAGWELALAHRGALPGEGSLAQAGVADGAIVHLRPAGESRPDPTRVCKRPATGGDGRGPLRRTVTIAVVSGGPGSGTSTVTALLATLLAHVGRDRQVAVDLVAGGQPPLRAPARGSIHLLDCGSDLAHEQLAGADQVVLVRDAGAATPTSLAQLARTLRPGAPPVVVVVVNGVTRRSAAVANPGAIDGALPDARGVLGLSWEPRLAARLARGAFDWTEKASRWDVEVRELAVILAADWERVGAAAPGALRSAGSPAG